ncbi:MAG TPA: GntR family transcriptional regulator [Solirubrobacteraceae bacterium]|nr:GntR family transcriptional regulator [Solirubrobacteraceae bacterium]
MPDAVTRAVEALRTMVLTGQIAPGSGLTQVGLAQEIGVSTTPLREALRRLEAEGLLESQRNGRPQVPRFDPADLDALYAGRVLLESLGIALSAPRLGETQLDVIRDHLGAMRGSDDPVGWDREHAAFHLALMVGSTDAFRQEIDRLVGRSDRYRRMSVRVDDSEGRRIGDEEHGMIVAACEARDGRDAALALARHLTRSALTLIAHLEPDYDPVAVRGALRMVMSWATG